MSNINTGINAPTNPSNADAANLPVGQQQPGPYIAGGDSGPRNACGANALNDPTAVPQMQPGPYVSGDTAFHKEESANLSQQSHEQPSAEHKQSKLDEIGAKIKRAVHGDKP
ncbi:hypothetical protein BZG36_04792 [Bifiguratus adelaidae]|uniref:Uncharacterized protein n=1 Tax=Bifiguratus adelaidae TaxID=1938954 RepID=A0A261XUA4_9FUNG|nr:hypothetical protein BZG36_04792 [Bifiguratus adelaidae]